MRDEVRAISIRNYWAWAVVYAGKNPENRSDGALGWKHRGLTLIHAPALLDDALNARLWWDDADEPRLEVPADDPRQTSLWSLSQAIRQARPETRDALGVRSAVMGVGDLVDIHPEEGGCCKPWGESVHWSLDRTQRTNWTAHLVFRDVVPVWPPVDCPGALGLWKPRPDVLEAVGLAA